MKFYGAGVRTYTRGLCNGKLSTGQGYRQRQLTRVSLGYWSFNHNNFIIKILDSGMFTGK